MNPPRGIMSLPSVRYPRDVTEGVPYFENILPHVRFFWIKGIQGGKEYFRDNVVSNDRGVCISKIIANNLYYH